MLNVLVKKDQVVKKGEPLVVTEAMKMETTIKAPFDGKVTHIYVKDGDVLASQDLHVLSSQRYCCHSIFSALVITCIGRPKSALKARFDTPI